MHTHLKYLIIIIASGRSEVIVFRSWQQCNKALTVDWWTFRDRVRCDLSLPIERQLNYEFSRTWDAHALAVFHIHDLSLCWLCVIGIKIQTIFFLRVITVAKNNRNLHCKLYWNGVCREPVQFMSLPLNISTGKTLIETWVEAMCTCLVHPSMMIIAIGSSNKE